ncbi:MAG: hypothetical protein WC682_02075 [Parcubacteria group bacterium]|jgi:hypothetical protein
MAKMLFRRRDVDSKKKILKILKKPEIAKVVDNLGEKKEVLSQFRRYSGGGITKDEARRILGKFHFDGRDSLDKKETAGLARALGIKGSHKYKKPEENFNRDREQENRKGGYTGISGKTFSGGNSKSGGFSKMSPLH